MLIDTHCHLDAAEFDADREQVADHACEAGVQSIVIPAIVMTPDNQLASWNDARLYGALAGAAWFFYRRSVMGTILVGMAVYLPLHLGLGW